MRSPSPTHSSSSVTLPRYIDSGSPRTLSGSATFSNVVRWSSRAEFLEHDADVPAHVEQRILVEGR